MAVHGDVLQFQLEAQGSADLLEVGEQLASLPALGRPALMGRGGAAPRYRLAEHLRMQRHVVCVFIEPAPELSPEQWAALCAARACAGRVLGDSEARSVLAAEGGDDVHH